MKYNQRLMVVIGGLVLTGTLILLHNMSYLDIDEQHKNGFEFRRNFVPNPGILALQKWTQFALRGENTSQIVVQFLENTLQNNNTSATLSLDDIGPLWMKFQTKMNVSTNQFDEDYDSISINDITSWAHFIKDVLHFSAKQEIMDNSGSEDEDYNEDTGSNNDADNDEYVEPPKRELTTETLGTLMSMLEDLNEVRLPRNDLGERLDIHENTGMSEFPAWKRFQNSIRRHQLYSSDDPDLEEVIQNLKYMPIKRVDSFPDGGTQTKIIFRMQDGSRALAKPKRMPIHIEANPDVFVFDEQERFYAEVAAFHLDRILGFNRVPPVASRYINLTEVKHQAPSEIRQTFYRSRANSVCFYGICDQYCDTNFGICGTPELLAVSFAFYLPSRNKADRESWLSPWKQSYSRHRDVAWIYNRSYCTALIKEDPVYTDTRMLLDLIDMAIFDFIQGNMDRHNYNTFEVFENDTNIFLYDNGRGFARSYLDEMRLIAPIKLCCKIRLSTFDRLLKLYTDDVSLGQRLKHSLATETVRPLLTKKQLRAVDRRLVIVLEMVFDCVSKSSGRYQSVVIDDGF